MGLRVAFYKATRPGWQGLFNRLVRWWTNGPYSHVEAVIFTYPDGTSICGSSSFIDGGVRIKQITLDPDHWDIKEIDADPLRAFQWFMLHHGQAYDTIALFGHIWRRSDGDKDKWDCIEAVLAAAGFKEAWRHDPNAAAAFIDYYQQHNNKTIAGGFQCKTSF